MLRGLLPLRSVTGEARDREAPRPTGRWCVEPAKSTPCHGQDPSLPTPVSIVGCHRQFQWGGGGLSAFRFRLYPLSTSGELLRVRDARVGLGASRSLASPVGGLSLRSLRHAMARIHPSLPLSALSAVTDNFNGEGED